MNNFNKDIVAIYISKCVIGKKTFVKQIAIVFSRNNKFKYLVKYIKNDITNVKNAVDLKDALKTIYEKIKNKQIILFNENGSDCLFLKEKFKSELNINFTNVIYDVSSLAKKLGVKKFNLLNLAHINKCYVCNSLGLPKSVNLAQNLYIVGVKLFLL
ncbi:MAG: hypothetical protein RSA40_00220 [Malacoplasma sp.]